jgi:hypothetical protein
MEESRGKILIYKNERGDVKIDVYFANSELWLSQKALSELYQVSIPTINFHVKNIIEEGGLEAEATIRNYLIVQTAFTGRKVLDNAGKISAEQALLIAEQEYELYDQHRKQSDNLIDSLVIEAKRLSEDKK